MRRRSTRHPFPGLTAPLAGGCLAAFVAVVAPGCGELRLADTRDGGFPDPDSSVASDADPGVDAQVPGTDAGSDAAQNRLLYDDAQRALEAKRFPGPPTAQGSKGYCTPQYFVWRESDGTLHSWGAKTQTRIDYGFKAGGMRSYFVPSETFVAVDVLPSYSQIDVYRTDLANTLVSSIPYAFNFVTASNGVIRLDQDVIGGTKVRLWNAATGMTEDLTAVLPTGEPPSSFVNDTLVIPGGITIPYALWLVDVVKKTTGSVTFDGGIALQQTEEGAGGLVVSYVRNGTSGAAMRVYKDNQDAASSRFELGDEVANRASYFADGPNLEHKFLARVTTWKQKVLYASAYGIWSYDLVTGALAPVQLVAGKKTAIPDVMCVLRGADLLVYRMSGDTLGQVWAVPLNNL